MPWEAAIQNAMRIARKYADGGFLDPKPMSQPQQFRTAPQKSPRQRVLEGHQDLEPGYIRGWDWNDGPDYPVGIKNMRGQDLQLRRAADGGAIDPEDESQAFADRPQMVSDEDLALAEVNKKAAPREGGLMQTVPQFAQMVQTPEGRGKIAEGARRWFTGDEQGKDTSWVPSPTENPLVKPVVEMVKGPGEAMQGKMTPEQQAEWGAGTAMGLVGAGTFGAYSGPKGNIGVFGGRGSAMADTGALTRAEQMESKGVNRDQIWKDTGWGRDASGEWMYHHDVSQAKLADLPQHPLYPDNVHIPEGKAVKLDKVLNDPGLYKAYPFLKDYIVVGQDHLGMGESLGVHLEKQKAIAVSPQQPGSLFNTLIHEVNHAIQSKENFALGGNKAMFLPREYQETALRLQGQEKLLNQYLKKNRIPIKDAWEAMYQVVHDPGTVSPRQERLVDRVLRGGKYDDMADFIEKTSMHHELRKEAESNYYRLAGEISSRNAEFRARMTPEESRQMTPWESQTKMKRPVAPGKELTVEFANQPTEQHSTRDRMSPEEAIRWIREHTIVRDPEYMWGYSNPQDYVALVERMREAQRDPVGWARRMNEESAQRQQGQETPGEAIRRYVEEHPKQPTPRQQADEIEALLRGRPSRRQGITHPTIEEEFGPEPELPKELPKELRGESIADFDADRYYGNSDMGPEPPLSHPSPHLPSDSVVAAFDKHLGQHYPNTEAFFKDFFGGMARPEDTTLTWRAHDPHSGYPMEHTGFIANSLLRNKDGRIVGSVDRYFNPETKTAYHAYLRIEEGARGKGSIPAMLENQINLYRKLGIEKVKLGANIDVGGYAWAKYGFLPEKGEWDYMRGRFKAMVDAERIRLSTAISPSRNYSAKDAVMEVLNNPEPEAMWHLTDLNIQAEPGKSVGKWFLMNTSWGGTLHLTNPKALSRFNEYVTIKKKQANEGKK